MPLIGRQLRRKAQQFQMLEELWLIFEEAGGSAPQIAWLIAPGRQQQITGLIPAAGAAEMRESFQTWTNLVGAREEGEVTVDGVTNLKAVAGAYGPNLIRIAILAEIWPPDSALRVLP